MNELEKRAAAHEKKKDGLSPFCSLGEASYASGDRYYGGLPAEPAYDGPNVKYPRYWKEVTQYFVDTVPEYPEYYILGKSPFSILLRTPDGKEKIDLRKFDALADAEEAVEMASHYFDPELFEAKKKKKPYDSINTDAGNVEHNVAMFNKMNSPTESPCTNPVSGPMGGDVGCCEALKSKREKHFQYWMINDTVHVNNDKMSTRYDVVEDNVMTPFEGIDAVNAYLMDKYGVEIEDTVDKTPKEKKRYPLYVYKAISDAVANLDEIPEDRKEAFITLVGSRCEEKRIPRVGWKSAKLPAAIIRKFDLTMYGSDNYRAFCPFDGGTNRSGLTLEEALLEIYEAMKSKWFIDADESLTEAMPPKKETIELEYKDLEFTQYGNQRDADDWDEWDRCMDWTYEVDKDDLYTFIFESCIDESDFPEAFEDDFDPNNAEHWARFESWLDDNFDTIYSKYEEKILENWEEDAQEEAAEEYDPDDYVDWDSMPGGHDDDRYWEDLKEGEEVFMEKYSYGLTEEYKREPRMTDYFEQMNSEDDEA